VTDGVRLSAVILSAKDLAGIGSVIVESTLCELIVEKIIWALCGLKPEQGKFLTDRMQLDKRLELIGDLWKPALDDAKRATLTKLISDLKETNNDRNIIVHGHWVLQMVGTEDADTSPEGILNGRGWLTPPSPVAQKRKLKSAPAEFAADKLEETAERISLLTSALCEFARESGIVVA
jgi:hypothetical protein